MFSHISLRGDSTEIALNFSSHLSRDDKRSFKNGIAHGETIELAESTALAFQEGVSTRNALKRQRYGGKFEDKNGDRR